MSNKKYIKEIKKEMDKAEKAIFPYQRVGIYQALLATIIFKLQSGNLMTWGDHVKEMDYIKLEEI